MAYPQAASIVNALCNSALVLGLPEARLPLAQATILLATAPKSNSVVMAIDSAIADINNKDCGDIPAHLKDAHYGGASKLGRGIDYKYPHNYENNYIPQQYLPDNIKNSVYYNYGNNKLERATEEYWKKALLRQRRKIYRFMFRSVFQHSMNMPMTKNSRMGLINFWESLNFLQWNQHFSFSNGLTRR